uniref:Uncharacterized protein n=1 Tax=Panagrolaimus sp. ES5 TaxID=591445 RepID=A0AC34GB56_9BILA
MKEHIILSFIFMFWITSSLADFNTEYTHTQGNRVPTISTVEVEENGQKVFSHEMPVNEVLRIEVTGENLKDVGKVSVSSIGLCEASTDVWFIVHSDATIYFENTFQQ